MEQLGGIGAALVPSLMKVGLELLEQTPTLPGAGADRQLLDTSGASETSNGADPWMEPIPEDCWMRPGDVFTIAYSDHVESLIGDMGCTLSRGCGSV